MKKAWNQADDFGCVETIDLEPCEALDRVRFLEPDHLIPIEQVKDEKGRLCWQTIRFDELQKQFARNRKYRHRARRELRRLNKQVENLSKQLVGWTRGRRQTFFVEIPPLEIPELFEDLSDKRWWEFWK